MDSKNFSSYILNQKKELFIQIVHQACIELNLAVPLINFDGCPYENENQLAHIHTDKNIICVSEMQLHKLNFVDIKEVATHEVIHMLHSNHNDEFQKEHSKIKQSIWKQPASVIFLKKEDGQHKIKLKKKRFEPDECSKHDCREKATGRCVFCHKLYCKKHIDAKLSSAPNFDSSTIEDEIKMNEWRREDAHPCPDYTEICYKAKRNEATPSYYWISKSVKKREDEIETRNDNEVSTNKHKSMVKLVDSLKIQNPLLIKLLVLISILVIVVYILYNQKASEALINLHKDLKDWKNNLMHTRPCTEYIEHGTCLALKPLYCNDTKIIENSALCGCGENQRPFGNGCVPIIECSDGTLAPECSKNKPYQCLNGSLVPKASICGCPENHVAINDTCQEIKRCSDGTIYFQCSRNKPKYCDNGLLLDKPEICGCPEDLFFNGEKCLSKYEKFPVNKNYMYVLRGQRGNISLTVYGGLNNYLASLPRSVICYNNICPSDKEILMRYIDEPNQKPYISQIVESIRKITNNKDDQARIAISMVQHIPYDDDSFLNNISKIRYPYQVLYDNKGVCGEKSKLLALLLRELGFGVALFEYKAENHMVVGIKCPRQYSYHDSGFCFVETTRPTIITYSGGEYVGVGKLSSKPIIYQIADGEEMTTVSIEYYDANRYEKIIRMGPVVDKWTYNEWIMLAAKYGIQTESSSSSSNIKNNENRASYTYEKCGSLNEKCCRLFIDRGDSGTLYEICEGGLRCINQTCISG